MQTVYDGSYCTSDKPEMTEQQGKIEEGKAMVRQTPLKYQAIMYQSSMVDWPEDQQKYVRLHTAGSDALQTKRACHNNVQLVLKSANLLELSICR